MMSVITWVVADFHDYFVSNAKVLVHDNLLRGPTLTTVPGLAENQVMKSRLPAERANMRTFSWSRVSGILLRFLQLFRSHRLHMPMCRLNLPIRRRNWVQQALQAEAIGKPDERADLLKQRWQRLQILLRPIGNRARFVLEINGLLLMMPPNRTRIRPSSMSIGSCVIKRRKLSMTNSA